MEGEKKENTEYHAGEESQKKEDQVQSWVQTNGADFVRPDVFREKYYANLGIVREQPQLQKQETYEKQQTTLNIYTPKSADEIRNRYINKLIQMGIMKEGPKKKFQHLFIFDWDDTLLCTSYLSALHFIDLTPETKNVLTRLDDVVTKLLELTLQRGDVFIITNATEGWVQYSSRLYLPKTHSIIDKKTISIISARSKYGAEFPGDYGRWKIEAFKSILKTIDPDLLTNMICMGDSNIEIEAAHFLGKEFDQAVVKTIKFRENPKPDEMIKQLTLVVQKFRQIFDSNKSLTIRLERKK